MLIIRIILSLLVLFIGQVTHAQQHHFVRRQMDLPSQECYNIYQDSKGYIWFSTVRGFCKYDGKTTKVFDHKYGLYENSVYSVLEDPKGRIWLLTRKSRILYIENDQIHEPEFGKKFASLPELSIVNFGHHFHFSNNFSELIVHTQERAYRIKLKTNEIIPIEAVVKSDGNNLELRFIGSQLGQITPAFFGSREKIDLLITDENKNQILNLPDFKVDPAFVPKVSRTTYIKNKHYFSFANIIFSYDADGGAFEKVHLGGRIICVYKDRGNGLWVGVIGKGVYYFSNGDLSKKPINSLLECSVSGIHEDREGGIWATTLNKGVFYASSKHLITYASIAGFDMQGTMLTTVNKKLLFGSESGALFCVDPLSVEKIPFNVKISEPLTDAVFFKNEYVISNVLSTMILDKDFKHARFNKRTDNDALFSSKNLKIYDDTVFAALNDYLFFYDEQLKKFTPYLHAPIKVKEFAKVGQGQWLIGDYTLFLCDPKGGKPLKINGTTHRLSKIKNLNDGKVLVSTVGGGLYVYQNKQVISINTFIPSFPTVVYDFVEDNRKNIFTATNKGVVRLNLRGMSMKYFGTDHGIISNDIQRIAIMDGALYMATVEGLCTIPIKELEKSDVAPIFYLESAHFSGVRYPLKGSPEINYDHNNLSLRSSILHYSPKDIFLAYEMNLNGKKINSELVDGTDLVLDNLTPGQYNVKLFGVNEEGKASNVVTYSFYIKKPFYQTWWFIALGLMLLFGLGFLLFMYITKTIKRREEEKTRINALIANGRLMALQAQMNPHFIFNAINSIQNFVLKRDVAQAYDYLTKFSQLIRLVLENSRKLEATLEEELTILRLYVTLEQLRFDNRFEFLTEIEEDVDPFNITIPPMLIQPIIENAIWHGVMPLEKTIKGIVKLSISLEDTILKIVVEDNGVGRDMTKKDDLHESIAMGLTQERLDIVNLIKDAKDANIFVDDLVDENGNACGTKVFLFIPIDKEV